MVSGKLEIIFGFILIFSFGILHGSNDILLINSITTKKEKYSFFKVLVTYLLTVLSAVIIFYFFPLVGLILFIMLSAYHFGEQHWEGKLSNISKIVKDIYYLIYGLLLLHLLFILNTDDVIEVVFSISGYTISKDLIIYSFAFNCFVFISLTTFFFLKFSSFQKTIIIELFLLLIFAIIFKVSTLIWGFTIYFVFWHSIPSLFEQVTFIYGAFNKKNVSSYCLKAIPYWLLSLIGILIVYFIFKEEKIFYAIFFSFIAAVTFPHALIINKMFINKKTQPK
ncbi:Brp/Blh family beta-carotene 15,15'-dioxygenase [Hyunsoonleella aestuarii]|uniref:Brp/Blh family beta-carotene 15,15'-dioxygenase n=1 Tax=Hyunsoonleella aestuarii TaxID=912802 RepID=UPI001FE301BE|nr:Brp/Blh family beta-carotene 15,15'-dioxygenase [Hyunsoonleella aestuarii]